MTVPPILPTLCPLCGEPNECGAAAGAAECWCYAAAIPRAVLDRVPDAAKGVACVCRTCAAGRTSAPKRLEQLNSLLRRR